MTQITINIPEKYSSYISEDNDLQNVLTEFFLDYIESKEDIKLRENLSKSKKFNELNSKLNKKLWNL